MSGLKKEMHLLKIMEGKFRLEERSKALRTISNSDDYPNKYIDGELNYMKEIREAYFTPKKEEIKQAKRYHEMIKEKHEKGSHWSPYEITEAAPSTDKIFSSHKNIELKNKTIEVNCRNLLKQRLKG